MTTAPERKQAKSDRAWWRRYNGYLESDEWRQKRAMVLMRSPICESCGIERASQAHHLSYRHVFQEPLFDLVAICIECHDRLTELDREGAR